MYLLGIDVGSSSIKAAVLDASTGNALGSAFYPETEMEMMAKQPGWAEQRPETWWENTKKAVQKVLKENDIDGQKIQAVGISYQMHGLVLIDQNREVLRPSIIWCDSRAVEIGDAAFEALGEEKCLSHLLNSPGNFTASKLRWVKENEPEIFERIDKIMLPGDYIAMKMTDEVCTTVSGLSEGMFWDYTTNDLAYFLLDHYEISADVIPAIVPTFATQGKLTAEAAHDLGISASAVVSYRAGDQPNNALSLGVMEPGEIAATGGTSGVVYGVTDEIKYDRYARVNSFAHVNHTADNRRLGILSCVNGTGSLNSWVKRTFAPQLTYQEMNDIAAKAPIGSNELSILPFGNGAERLLENKQIGAQMSGFNFNTHTNADVFRATHEGIAFAFKYGLDIMKYKMGLNPQVMRAGHANMFLSPIFRNTLATISGVAIELYETDGALGAARGAGMGSGVYANHKEAFQGLKRIDEVAPLNGQVQAGCQESYDRWLNTLNKHI